jgi:hypothetical protein
MVQIFGGRSARMKRLVADLTLDKQVLKDLLGKKA